MKNKKMMSVAFVFLLSTMVPTYFVWANDDDDEYEHEYEEHDREDDENEYEEDDEQENENEYEYEDEDVETQEFGKKDDSQYSEEVDEQQDDKKDDSTYRKQVNEQRSVNRNNQNVQGAIVDTAPDVTWDTWSRSVATNRGELPFANPKTVTIESQDGKLLNSYVIPSQGEMMIATVSIAQLIGVEVTYYPTNKIAEMKLDGKELIIKSGSNAVYENDKKTPMPVEAMMYQDELYMPISVLTNGLGLTVTWDEEKQTFLIQQ